MRAGTTNILDEADRTREFSPFVDQILIKRVNAISYPAVGRVAIFEVANIVRVKRMCRLGYWWM